MEITLNPYIQVVSLSLFVIMLLLAYRLFMKAFVNDSNKDYAFAYFFVAIAFVELSIFAYIRFPYLGLLALMPFIASIIFLIKNESQGK